jgi:type II secretory pathway component PulM
MILSRRERYIVIGTVAVVGLLALDHLFLTPLTERREVINAQMHLRQEEMTRATMLLDSRARMNRKWLEMSGTALKTDGATAESQIIRSVGDWALDAGLNLSSLKPERAEKDKQFQKIAFRANGTGNMLAISKFIWRLQTSKIPVRVTDISITTRRDGTDDLSLDMGMSTLYQPPETNKTETAIKQTEPQTREGRS